MIVLALAWAVVFLPAVLKAREVAPYSSAERFRRRMDLIAPQQGGRFVISPKVHGERARTSYRIARRHQRIQRRRFRVFALLLLSVPTTAGVALVAGGPWWEVHLGALASLGGYVVFLLEARKRRRERSQKVRPIKSTRDYRIPEEEVVELHEPTAGGL